jgi:hypothetical protein
VHGEVARVLHDVVGVKKHNPHTSLAARRAPRRAWITLFIGLHRCAISAGRRANDTHLQAWG